MVLWHLYLKMYAMKIEETKVEKVSTATGTDKNIYFFFRKHKTGSERSLRVVHFSGQYSKVWTIRGAMYNQSAHFHHRPVQPYE